MKPLLTLLLMTTLGGQAQEVEINASLNRSSAQVGETVLLTVTLRASGLRSPEIEDPRLEGLEVLSVTDRSTFRFSASLGAIREFSREYTLRVLEAGELSIPPIRAAVDGETFETEALSLAVEREGAASSIPSGLGPRAEEEVAVRLWVEPETAFVGQQVTLTVGAFFDPLVRSRLQRQPEYRPPDVQGFWSAELPGSVRPERRVVNDREYFVQIYRRALFPLSPGTLRIPPAAVIYEVRRGLIYAPETFQVESAPANIVVRPLPPEGAPLDFAGAVGRFQTEIWFDRSDMRAGEAVRLVLDVTGSGNLSSLARPEFPEVPGVRVYDGGEDGEVQLRGTEFAGYKRFSWVLVPERPGGYVVPELRLPFFDPIEATYRVARTEPVTLTVESGSATAVLSGTPSGTAIRYVKARTGRQPANLPVKRSFWILQLVPVFVLLGVVVWGRFRRRAPGVARQRPQRRQKLLRHLRPLAASGDPAFFGQLRAAMIGWLQARLHRPGLSTHGIVQLQHTLEDAGVPPPVALEVIDLLERCGRLRYAPDPPGAEVSREMLSEADRLLALVDREAVSEKSLRTSSSGSGPAAAVALALLILTPGAAAAQQGAAGLDLVLQEAIGAYGRGDYIVAAELFGAALAERPADPNLLYNLGNSYYELDERGRAVAYWVRALRIQPRDSDARFNLRLVIGDDPVVGSAVPPLPLSTDELAVLFALFWFAGCALLVARHRWRKGYLTFAGGASFTMAVLLAVFMLYPKPDYAIVATSDAALRAGPVGQSEVLATPSAGTGFLVQEDRGDWLRVSAGGSEGWIERVQIERVD
jgi:hypothetical protein